MCSVYVSPFECSCGRWNGIKTGRHRKPLLVELMKGGHNATALVIAFPSSGRPFSPSYSPYPPLPPASLPPPRSLTVLRVLFVIGIPLTIINISFACAYAWLFANQYAYTKDDWQRCLIYPNQVGSEEGRKGSEGGKAEEDGWREHAWIYGVCFA